MSCATCGTENPVGRKFCGGCGCPLARPCGTCGALNEPRFGFCGECGSRIDAPVAPEASAAARGGGDAMTAPGDSEPVSAGKAERRLVSVLFVDLVGFTTLSEERDPEDVRELLSRYFAACRSRIERYGGTVEKFIGDAVMAVWGAPAANEDDAERAVRASLDILEAVRAMGQDVGAPELAARAGVLTGEVAVNVGVVGEGMVAGDLVNTASRVQAVAAVGTVLVDDATRRATEAAVAYEDGGTHELKGKREPVSLWRALRVVAGRGGALKSAGLEAPFVGRARQFGLVKELLHSCADQRVAHLTSVIGQAGIGKSRLTWELFKYVDGLTDTVWWNRGRCLAYGEGVTYWALAEMIRGRAGIREDEPAESAVAKLRTAVADAVADEAERRWVYPRLASLLALEDQETPSAADLFSGWRLYFERMSEQHPLILVFEDLQWADAALLDFIEYLLDWSRNYPLYVLTLSRPDLLDRRPMWAAARHNVTSVSLEPLSDEAMEELLEGLAPGLPSGVREQISNRAEGVPLFAVETVRMLVDNGALLREGDRYVAVGTFEDLDVPQSLKALIAARLDGLKPLERSLLQNASVLGKTFTVSALASVSRGAPAELEPVLQGLVRKELLAVQADPRSPEQGQYGFLQSLVQKVSHDTLSRRDRKALHLAAAAYLQQNWSVEEGEVVQVIASHFFDAYIADPNARDAANIRADAREFLTRAGDRAADLAAQSEAERYFLRAAELSEDGALRADLLLRSAIAAARGGDQGAAEPRLREAAETFRAAGNRVGEARAHRETALILWTHRGAMDDALRLLRRAEELLEETEADDLRADVAATKGRLLFFSGRLGDALPALEQALQLAEARRLSPVLSDAMNTKALVLQAQHRQEEALILLEGALRVAEASGVSAAMLRAYVNLSYICSEQDRYRDGAAYAEAGVTLARKVGDRTLEWFLLGHLAAYAWWTGDWDGGERIANDIAATHDTTNSDAPMQCVRILIRSARGELDRLDGPVAFFQTLLDSGDLQNRTIAMTTLAVADGARGEHHRAIDQAQRALLEAPALAGMRHPIIRVALPLIVDSALECNAIVTAQQLLDNLESLPPGHLSPFLMAQIAESRARISAARGIDDGVEELFRAAVRILSQPDVPYFRARVQGFLAEWLDEQGQRADAERAAADALMAFERLQARPWLARLAALGPTEVATA
jgi:class 3 adenylate cyclase/tetratricopeptide (TPR) repeat protein